MIRLFLCSFALFLISGCAASGRIAQIPSIPQNTPSSEIVLIRENNFVGAANSYYIALDGVDIFSIRSGDHTQFPIITGEHFVAVKCFGGWSPTWKEESTKFTAMPGEKYYFLIQPTISCAEIKMIEEIDAQKYLQKSNYIDPKIE